MSTKTFSSCTYPCFPLPHQSYLKTCTEKYFCGVFVAHWYCRFFFWKNYHIFDRYSAKNNILLNQSFGNSLEICLWKTIKNLAKGSVNPALPSVCQCLSVCKKVFSRLAHYYFFLIFFCMNLGFNKHIKRWWAYILRKILTMFKME